MKNGFFSRFCGWKDKAYDALFAKKIEAEQKATMWKVLFIVTVSILAVAAAGVTVYYVLKNKFDKDIVAMLKERFSKKCCCEGNAEEALDEALEADVVEAEDAAVEVVEA